MNLLGAASMLGPALALAALSACTGGDRAENVAPTPPAPLIVMPRATDVVVSQANALGELYVSFHVPAPFPAAGTIAAIESHLLEAHFVPREFQLLNPSLRVKDGDPWAAFGDATMSPPGCVRQWWGEWEDPSGNVVSYILRYRWSSDGWSNCDRNPTTLDLWVVGMLSPPEAVKAHSRDALDLAAKPRVP